MIEYLEKQIENGVYANGHKLPSEAALAEMFNASRITSKRALQELELKGVIYRRKGSGSFVTEHHSLKTLKNTHILSNNAKLYENSIDCILPFDALEGKFNKILQIKSTTGILEKHGYHLTLHNSMENEEVEREIISKIVQNNTKGIILYPHYDRANLDLLYEVWRRKIPIAVIDKKIPDIPICSIYSDNTAGAYLLTQELIENGHTKIACLYRRDLNDVFTIRHRFFGYCSSLLDNGMDVNYNYIINDYSRMLDNGVIFESLLGDILDMGITAVIGESDYTALNIIEACFRLGIKVPDELSVVGFDNAYQSETSNPPLTTVDQDFTAMGKLAAEAIIAQLTNKSYETDQIVPVELIRRQSVKKLK